MSLFAIGDLHLSLSVPNKTMSVFKGWDNHMQILENNWNRLISPEDTVVLVGDSSWAMRIDDAVEDFAFINKLNGKKLILKGNHDYWWTSLQKMNDFFEKHSFNNLSILHMNHYQYEDYGICGSRGWVNMDGEPHDEKVLKREAMRLEASIKSAVAANLKPLVFLHYPPVFQSACSYEILDVLYKYNISECYYAHIHGYACKNAITGVSDNINFTMLSSDYLQFVPKQIL